MYKLNYIVQIKFEKQSVENLSFCKAVYLI